MWEAVGIICQLAKTKGNSAKVVWVMDEGDSLLTAADRRRELQTTTKKGIDKRDEIWGAACIVCQLAMIKGNSPRHRVVEVQQYSLLVAADRRPEQLQKTNERGN